MYNSLVVFLYVLPPFTLPGREMCQWTILICVEGGGGGGVNLTMCCDLGSILVWDPPRCRYNLNNAEYHFNCSVLCRGWPGSRGAGHGGGQPGPLGPWSVGGELRAELLARRSHVVPVLRGQVKEGNRTRVNSQCYNLTAKIREQDFFGKVFVHGAMGHLINPSRWTHWAISCFSQCSTTGIPKAVVCAILSMGWCI